jgi:hypothetical protein
MNKQATGGFSILRLLKINKRYLKLDDRARIAAAHVPLMPTECTICRVGSTLAHEHRLRNAGRTSSSRGWAAIPSLATGTTIALAGRVEVPTRSQLVNGLLIVAILAVSTSPLYAQAQQPNIAKLKADARNVVGTIANDKAKTQAYCQTLDLARQLERADQEKDRKKAGVLSQKINRRNARRTSSSRAGRMTDGLVPP